MIGTYWVGAFEVSVEELLFVVFCAEAFFDAMEDIFQVGLDDFVVDFAAVAFAC